MKTAAIVGARGYAGLELARLLFKHPGVKLTHAFATQEFKLSDDLLEKQATQVICLPESELFKNLTDVVFLATPADVSMRLAPQIMKQGKLVIDLSGAFRLKNSDMMHWYGFDQQAAQELKAAEYGLVPFCGPFDKAIRLIANPGCYATAVLMALLPLLKNDLIEPGSLMIDAKSGTTGAGRKANENQLFAEVDGECLPYRVGRHQHLPEIQEYVSLFAGHKVDPHMVTHLLPVKRGIIAGLYAQAKTDQLAEIEQAYAQEFNGYNLVRFGKKISQLARLKHVVGTAYTHISYELIGNKLYVFATIDNLLKGAASQAVENLNRSLDLAADFTLKGEQ